MIDNLAGKIYRSSTPIPTKPEAYAKAKQRLRELRQRLRRPVDRPYTSAGVRTETYREFAKDDYLAAVRKAKEYIAAGELMQVQIGQRIIKPYRDAPLSLYRALRSLNPSPYMYYYNFGDFHVVGASPEILVRQEKERGERSHRHDPSARRHAAARRHARARRGARDGTARTIRRKSPST